VKAGGVYDILKLNSITNSIVPEPYLYDIIHNFIPGTTKLYVNLIFSILSQFWH